MANLSGCLHRTISRGNTPNAQPLRPREAPACACPRCGGLPMALHWLGRGARFRHAHGPMDWPRGRATSWSTSWQPWLWLLSLVLIVPAAIALFAGLVHAWLLPGRLTSAALHADSTLGSKDLIRSTLELGSASSVGRETDRPFVGLLLAQAEQLAASVDVRRLVPLVPHHAPARMGWAAAHRGGLCRGRVLLPLPSLLDQRR